MLNTRHRACFEEHSLGRPPANLRQGLERYAPIQPDVMGEIHHTHTATADPLPDGKLLVKNGWQRCGTT
jgi:hypothetical protein